MQKLKLVLKTLTETLKAQRTETILSTSYTLGRYTRQCHEDSLHASSYNPNVMFFFRQDALPCRVATQQFYSKIYHDTVKYS